MIRLFTILVICLLSACGSIEKEQLPNVVFILVDDLGWSDLPAYGNQFHETPHIDRLAAEGLLFTDAYVASPVCSPSRASIMSGQYPARIGIIDFIPGHWRPYEEVIVPQNRTQYLPEETMTLGEMMKDAGYSTAYFGKWHLGNSPEHHPSNQGFDRAYETAGRYYGFDFNPSKPVDPKERLSETLTNMSLEFIEENQGHPFFLFLSHFDVHVPLDADDTLINKYLNKEKAEGYPSNAVYAAMIEHLDNSVGRIVGKLDELNLSENTMVVFFSDNGGLVSRFDKKSVMAKDKQDVHANDPRCCISTVNDPLRNEKGTLFEGGIRVPLIIKWPSEIDQPGQSSSLITGVDFFPTFLDLTGQSWTDNQVLDGESLIPILSGKEQKPDRTIYWHYPVYHHGFPASAGRQGDWKLIENLVNGEKMLFNLVEDLSETQNQINTYPERAADLYKLLSNWRGKVDARFPKENPNFDAEKRYEWGPHPGW